MEGDIFCAMEDEEMRVRAGERRKGEKAEEEQGNEGERKKNTGRRRKGKVEPEMMIEKEKNKN
jgi:hypothetical protein